MAVDIAETDILCSNPVCPDYGKLQTSTLIKKMGKTPKGRQRYQCKTCGQTFTETKGTFFYRLRTPEHEVLEILALIAEGIPISSLVETKRHKEGTILGWIREAARHAPAIEEVLRTDYHLQPEQMETLWSWLGPRSKEETIPSPRSGFSWRSGMPRSLLTPEIPEKKRRVGIRACGSSRGQGGCRA